ncbi:MAG: hypothetical protein ACRD0A_08915 [Acidimicrobiales bacterium]
MGPAGPRGPEGPRGPRGGGASIRAQQPRILDDAGFVGDDTSITVGSDGLPFMSYRDLSNVDLKVAHRKDEQCSAAGVISV